MHNHKDISHRKSYYAFINDSQVPDSDRNVYTKEKDCVCPYKTSIDSNDFPGVDIQIMLLIYHHYSFDWLPFFYRQFKLIIS